MHLHPHTNPFSRQPEINTREVRIDFSFRREVFFIIAGALVGGLAMMIPLTFFNIGSHPVYVTWEVFGHIVGVNSPITATIAAGLLIHLVTAICIGIIAGLFLYKTNILNISKPSNGLRYGLFVGTVVYLVFALPVEQFDLDAQFEQASHEENREYQNEITFSNIHLNSVLYSIFINLLFGVTLGLFSSLLTMKFGARYRCPQCDISFSRIDTLQNHLELSHSGNTPLKSMKRILILGGGFGGTAVLRKLQDRFQRDVTVDIAMVSKDNYLLFTPMLHEIASGMIETRHIVTPIRAFCNRSRFYCANVENIDLENKHVLIRSSSATPTDESKKDLEIDTKSLPYDYLVIALGSETKFFGMSDLQKNAFTLKSLNDAINLRNHIIYLLERSDQLLPAASVHDKELQNRLLTFVIVGGGFAGVETAGEINDFIHDSAKDYYHNVDSKNIRIIIVQSGNRLLPEMSEKLAKFALQKLRNSGVEVILNRRVIEATQDRIKLNDDTIILTNTIIWSAGVAPGPLTSSLTCDHDDKTRKIIVDKYLEVSKYHGVYAIGDCALIMDPNTGNPYPPTAQHAIREGSTAAKNIIASIDKKLDERKAFNYKTRGTMASIGKRTGVGNLLGTQVQGFLAWWIWRNYYLANLPTIQKKIRVLADWTLDIFFKRDVTMLKPLAEQKSIRGDIF
jgi:NADH dehydrogenase